MYPDTDASLPSVAFSLWVVDNVGPAWVFEKKTMMVHVEISYMMSTSIHNISYTQTVFIIHCHNSWHLPRGKIPTVPSANNRFLASRGPSEKATITFLSLMLDIGSALHLFLRCMIITIITGYYLSQRKKYFKYVVYLLSYTQVIYIIIPFRAIPVSGTKLLLPMTTDVALQETREFFCLFRCHILKI